VGKALRYTPEGTPIEIAVGVRTDADGTRRSVIEVRDHGPGVSEDEAARIFERFYRADTSRTRETGGSGLGLAIVAAIVGSHSGTVRVEPTEGGGATLVVSLPFLADAEPPEAELAGPEHGTDAAADPGPRPGPGSDVESGADSGVGSGAEPGGQARG
jgi:two-component system OmpR family sensor kinase